MPHRLLALLDHPAEHIVAMFGTLMATITSSLVLMADDSNPSQTDEIRLLLMPLIGALISTTGGLLFAPREAPRKLAGRSIFSVAIGTALPVTFGFVSDYGKLMAAHPVALFLAGLTVPIPVFILIRPLVDRLFADADKIADVAVNKVLERAHLSPEDEEN